MNIAELRRWYRGRFLPGSASAHEVTERLQVCRGWITQDNDTVEMLAGNSLASSPELADPQADDDRRFVEDVIHNLEKRLSDDR